MINEEVEGIIDDEGLEIPSEISEYSFFEGMPVAVLYRISRVRRKDYSKHVEKDERERQLQENEDKKLETQRVVLDEIIKKYGLVLTEEHTYRERHMANSRVGDIKKRPILQQLFKAAKNREFRALLLWKTDRLTRQGGWYLVRYIKRLNSYGVGVYSYHQGWLDISTNIKEFIAYTYGFADKSESDAQSKRVKDVRKKLIAEGKSVGGKKIPKLTEDEKEEIVKLRGLGYSVADILTYLHKSNEESESTTRIIYNYVRREGL